MGEKVRSVLEISQRTELVRTYRQKRRVPNDLKCPALCLIIHLTYLRSLIGSKYADAMASSEDPYQTAPLGAV